MKLLLQLSLAIAMTLLPESSLPAQLTVEDFDEVALFKLINTNGMELHVTNYGATITSIIVPDRDGNMADVALGFNSLEGYLNSPSKPFFGAVVGRFGNRIADGKFSLDGNEYTLATNDGPNHLHGGNFGFDKVVWDPKPVSGDGWTGLRLRYMARDGEEGYPGNLQATVTYKLTNSNQIVVNYHAATDKPTIVNLTQHTYFNLAGEGQETVLDHKLKINADQFIAIDDGAIPTGEIADVADTPFDYREFKSIGRDIDQPHEQLKNGIGYDHTFVLNKNDDPQTPNQLTLAAEVFEPKSGRVLAVHTLEPGVQFYCGNHLDGSITGKSGKPYIYRGGLCLETQHFPDSPNQPDFPSTVLRPGENYNTQTTFTFSTREQSVHDSE